MCSLTRECVLLPETVFSYYRKKKGPRRRWSELRNAKDTYKDTYIKGPRRRWSELRNATSGLCPLVHASAPVAFRFRLIAPVGFKFGLD